jgi:transaldolase
MNKYLLDTADINELKKININKECFLGLTTNPNALYNAGIDKFNFKEKIYELQTFIHGFSKTGNPEGELHLELPTSLMPISSIKDFLQFIFKNVDLKLTQICIKVPPHPYILKNLLYLKQEVGQEIWFNVTGVTNPLTALRCLKYSNSVKYISFLLGRMESEGINNITKMIQYIGPCLSGNQSIIMGSIRSYEHIAKSIELGCIPTIGVSKADKLNEISNHRKKVEYDELDEGILGIIGERSDVFNCDTVYNNFFDEMNKKSISKPIW